MNRIYYDKWKHKLRGLWKITWKEKVAVADVQTLCRRNYVRSSIK